MLEGEQATWGLAEDGGKAIRTVGARQGETVRVAAFVLVLVSRARHDKLMKNRQMEGD